MRISESRSLELYELGGTPAHASWRAGFVAA